MTQVQNFNCVVFLKSNFKTFLELKTLNFYSYILCIDIHFGGKKLASVLFNLITANERNQLQHAVYFCAAIIKINLQLYVFEIHIYRLIDVNFDPMKTSTVVCFVFLLLYFLHHE